MGGYRKPKHLDIVYNDEDTLNGKGRPNLVIQEEDNLVGYSITNNTYEWDVDKVPIYEDDLINNTHLKVNNTTRLTTNRNTLLKSKYPIKAHAKPSLWIRLLNKLRGIK